MSTQPLPRPSGTFRFDGKNEMSQAWAAEHAARYVTRVSNETKEAIRALVVASVRDGIPPAEAARMIRDLVGLNVRDAGAVMAYRSDLFKKGVLNRVSIGREVYKYAQRLIAKRATTIARTEIMGALNAGALEAARQAVEHGLLDPEAAVKRWLISRDEVTPACPVCMPLDGEEVALEAVFPGTDVLAPPAHPRCRCSFAVLPRRTRAPKAAPATGADPLSPQPAKDPADPLRAKGFPEADAVEIGARVAALERQGVHVKGLDITSKLWRTTIPTISERIDIVRNGILEMEEAIKALGVNRGRQKLVMDFGVHPTHKSAYAYANGARNVTINIPSRAWLRESTLRSMLQNDLASKFHPSGLVGDIMIHEVGHVRQMQRAMGARIRYFGFQIDHRTGQAGWLEQTAQQGGVFNVGQKRWDATLQKWVHDPTPEFKSIYTEFADPEAIALKVSRYAATGPHEFVAETWTGLIRGIKYDARVMRLYEMLGGAEVKVARAARAAAVVKPVIPPPPAPRVVVPPPAPRPAPAPGPGPVDPTKGLLPKGAKPVGDPIPLGDKGREIQQVIDLRKQGLSYQAIDRHFQKPPSAAGAWAIRILKRYGGGRL